MWHNAPLPRFDFSALTRPSLSSHLQVSYRAPPTSAPASTRISDVGQGLAGAGLPVPPPITKGASKEKDNSRRLARCGKCENCSRADCGTCYNCADKPKFGGPGVKKQACINRKCLLMVPKEELESNAAAKKRPPSAKSPLLPSPKRSVLSDSLALPEGFPERASLGQAWSALPRTASQFSSFSSRSASSSPEQRAATLDRSNSSSPEPPPNAPACPPRLPPPIRDTTREANATARAADQRKRTGAQQTGRPNSAKSGGVANSQAGTLTNGHTGVLNHSLNGRQAGQAARQAGAHRKEMLDDIAALDDFSIMDHEDEQLSLLMDLPLDLSEFEAAESAPASSAPASSAPAVAPSTERLEWKPVLPDGPPLEAGAWYDPLLLQAEFIEINERHRRASKWSTAISAF